MESPPWTMEKTKRSPQERPRTRRELRLQQCFLWRTCVLFFCTAFNGSWAKTRCCIMHIEETCAIFFLVRSWVFKSLLVRRDLKYFWWRTCVVYSTVRPSVGRGLRLVFSRTCIDHLIVRPWVRFHRWVESKGSMLYDVSWGNLRYLLACFLCRTCLLSCKAFGGSRVKTR